MRLSKIFRNVMLAQILLFGVIASATSVLSGWDLHRYLTDQFTSKGTAIVRNIAESGVDIVVNRDLSTLQSVVDQFAETDGVAYVYVADAQGTIVSHTFVPAIPREILSKQSDLSRRGTVRGIAIENYNLPGFGEIQDISSPILQGKAGSVHVGMKMQVIHDMVWQAIREQQTVLLGIFAITSLLAFALVNRISQPLNVLADHAQQLASQDFSKEVEVQADITEVARKDDELGGLARSFLLMERTLKDYIGQLEHSAEELEKYSQTLEQKVDERTLLLRERNRDLEKTLRQLRDAQNQIVMQEKMASLGSLTAGIAHEIKNPLNFVNNFAALAADLAGELRAEIDKMKEKIDAGPLEEMQGMVSDLEQNVRKINEHGKRADNIVKGMLLHSRGKPGEKMLTDLNPLVDEYVNLAYHGLRAQDPSFNVTIIRQYDSAVGKVNLVPQDISRVILNLINNACYSAHEKRMKLGNSFAPTLTVATQNLGDKVEIRVRDNGRGIPSAMREKIFNPFFTTKPAGKGTGLGLSISFDIVVEQHHGEFRVESQEGEYAEFIVVLPREQGLGIRGDEDEGHGGGRRAGHQAPL
jgi:signal transduction histidine kinase